MEIFWVLLASVSLATGYGNPMRYHSKGALEGNRNYNLQATPNLAKGFESQSSDESYQTSETNKQPKRNEHNKFGKGNFMISQDHNLALNYKEKNHEQAIQNKYSGVQNVFPGKNNRGVSPSAINGSPRIQEPGFNQQNLKQDSPLVFSSAIQIQPSIPSRETHDGLIKENDASKSAPHIQGHFESDAPSYVDHRSEVQAEVNQNTFNARLPELSNQMSFEGAAALQNNNNFRFPIDYRYSQNQQAFYQLPSEKDLAFNDDTRYFTENPSFTQQEQMPAFQVPQEQVNQHHQNSTEQNQKPSIFSLPTDAFNPRETTFDSKRMSPSLLVGQSPRPVSADQQKHIFSPAQFEEHVDEKLKKNERFQQSTDAYFKDSGSYDHQNPVAGQEQDIESGTLTNYQNLFQDIRKHQQPIATVPQFQHQAHTSIALAGAKTASTRPVMVYRTESIASPHAVVFVKDSSDLSKASITQYLQTPHAQYSYNHFL